MTSQQAEIMAILADGRYHPVSEFLAAYIPDYRKRLSELGQMFPARFESRYRTHHHKDGTTSRYKDWRDTHGDAARMRNLRAQAREHREAIGDDPHDPRELMPFTIDGRVVKGISAGRVMLLSDDELVDEVHAAYVEPE